VRSLVRADRRAAEFAEDSVEGWKKNPIDPCAVLPAFAALRLRPGYTLPAYWFSDGGGDANAFVYATSEAVRFLEPDECPTDPRHFLEPPTALDNVMDAITGDGTPWSYVSASFVARELREFGATWHGCNWKTHTILGGHPSHMTTDPDQWQWNEPAPDLWLLTIADTVTARFFTHTALEAERIVHHTDPFRPGTYRFDEETAFIARGPDGFIF
jgi:hypothetical protein